MCKQPSPLRSHLINFRSFDFIISKFKRSKKRNYDFIEKAGPQFQSVVFKFCKVISEEQKFTDSFKNTTLYMICNGDLKGRREMLPSNRFIHSKSMFSRTAEALVVVEGLKQPLIDDSSMYQIRGQPGNRAEELVFCLKSIMSKYRKEGKSIIIQTSDIAKKFDKKMIEGAIISCVNRGANKKACRLWYKLNENTKI